MTAKKTNAKTAKTEDLLKTAQDTVKDNIEKSVEYAQNYFGDATKNYDDAVALNKENYEASVEASKAAVKAAQTVNSELFAASQSAVEKNVEAFKSLFSAKTPAEFFDMQANIMKARYEEVVSETTRLNEVAVNAATEAGAPIKSRYENVAKKYNLPLVG